MTDEQYTELNESIDRLSNNTQDTNNAVNDLREYRSNRREGICASSSKRSAQCSSNTFHCVPFLQS